MSDPSLALQAAQFSALRASGALPTVVGGRVHDRVPDNPAFPYVNVGEGQVLGEDTEDCGDGSEVFSRVHAWSREPGFPQVKAIAAAIRATLKTPLTLAGFTVSVTEYVQTQYLRDPDGLTSHAVVEFRYLITHTG